MRPHATSIEIESSPANAFAFLADGAKLPLWAIGFAKAIEPDGERWLVRSPAAIVCPCESTVTPAQVS